MGKSIREGTVKSHVNNIMQKLGALLAQTAAICALRKGLIKMQYTVSHIVVMSPQVNWLFFKAVRARTGGEA
jgi:hypothetical protein